MQGHRAGFPHLLRRNIQHYGRACQVPLSIWVKLERKGDFFMAERDESVLLESYKNFSNKVSSDKPGRCPKARFWVEGVSYDSEGNEVYFRSFAGCKQWSCPVCSKKLSSGLRRGLLRGFKAYFQERGKGYSPKYFFKMVSLTVPGQEWRRRVDVSNAERLVKESLVKLVAALRRRYGKSLEYVWVDEKQRDGYPHIHLCIMGPAAVPAAVYGYITHLWRSRYKMGFTFVSTDKKDRGIEGIVFYLTKYVTKGMLTNVKGKRVFSMSKAIKTLSKREKPVYTLLAYGFIDYNDDGSMNYRTVWSAPDYTGPPDEANVLEDLLQFFEDRKNEHLVGVQLEIF